MTSSEFHQGPEPDTNPWIMEGPPMGWKENGEVHSKEDGRGIIQAQKGDIIFITMPVVGVEEMGRLVKEMRELGFNAGINFIIKTYAIEVGQVIRVGKPEDATDFPA